VLFCDGCICSALNDNTGRLPSWTDDLAEKDLILPVVRMGCRQAAQPALQHQHPEWAVLEARKPKVGRGR